jgi:3-dehydroquinate synthase
MKEIFSKAYKINFGTESLTQVSEFLIEKSYSQVFVLVDKHTKKDCLPILKPYLAQFHSIEIGAGERFKNIDTVQEIWKQFHHFNADRSSLLINLGGGVICDMGGFAAATFKRGIDFIHIPTTLLGMVDAAIGGKLGIDFLGIKNEIGLFKLPKRIVVNPLFLETLPKDELNSGFAELIKHALIADKKLWKSIQELTDLNSKELEVLIYKSIKIKTKIVAKDPTEKGIRKALNFGHTIGHAIESASLISKKKPMLHGHAVAIGMLAEAWLSKELGFLKTTEFEQINALFKKYFKRLPNEINFESLLSIMQHDKKNKNGLIQFSLIDKIGSYKLDINCETDVIEKAILYCVENNE